jgi:two-component system, NarL family, sensor histidine kinase DesK
MKWWPVVRDRIAGHPARQWYVGACFGLLYQVLTISSMWSAPIPTWAKVVATVMLVPVYVGWMFLPPIFWSETRRRRLIVVALYWLYTFLFIPFIGQYFFWLWVLVGAIAATLFEETLNVLIVAIALVITPLVYEFVVGWSDTVWISSVVNFAVMSMMFAINRQLQSVRKLREAQGEVARLAVVEERARFSRDMHDVLGHSLTVVTVKSELARRLVSIDPARAEAEIADIERLSRAALADLRAAVAGYRQMSLTTELGAAQAALAAANIRAHLPASGDVASPELQDLFGWVLREAVTNVIRHSGATNCWVDVTRTELRVADDGRGLPAIGGGGTLGAGGVAVACAGTGLKGLTERATAVGAELDLSPSEHGGLLLAVRR